MDERSENFRRNELLENLLDELGRDLEPAENSVLAGYSGQAMQYPLVLVMGPLRSGTTLFTQWLSNTGMVAYPSNLLSRFYRAPVIGAKIQLLLTDPRYSFRDELAGLVQDAEYRSENGKTRGALAPNEFWYFWRRFLSDPARDVWTDDELAGSMDVDGLQAELAGLMDVFDKPFLAKTMLFNYNIRFLASIFRKAVFVQMKRDPASNVDSILDARARQFGNAETWYSFRIPEYDALKDLAPAEQVAGQVYYNNRAIDKGLEGVEDNRKMTVQYEEFCRDPLSTWNELLTKLAANGYQAGDGYSPDTQFRVSRTDIKNSGVQAACRKFYD